MFVQDESGVDELARPQTPVGVGELPFETYRTGLRVNTVIHEA